MTRAEMVEQIASMIVTRRQFDSTAEAILDVILPQITTETELEALPDGSVVVDRYGRPWLARDSWRNKREWSVTGNEVEGPSSYLATLGPLTVVWKPSS